MALIYPEIPDSFNSSIGEKKIFTALKKMSDDWNVYYSVAWQNRDNNGIIRWGEADFVVFNPQKGIIVIEVKSGGIEFDKGKWVQTRLDTLEKFEMKNPFRQADRNKYKIKSDIDNCLMWGGKVSC